MHWKNANKAARLQTDRQRDAQQRHGGSGNKEPVLVEAAQIPPLTSVHHPAGHQLFLQLMK